MQFSMSSQVARPTSIGENNYFANSKSSYKTVERVKTTGVIGSTFAKALLVAALALPSTPTTALKPNIVVTGKIVTSRDEMASSNGTIKDGHSSRLSQTSLSKELQKDFGFKVAQWAYVLKVGRKTLYNWEQFPDTNVHSKATERLMVLKSFRDLMDTGHSKFISKLTFNREHDNAFLKAFDKSELSLAELDSIYDANYIKLDGMYKRQLHADKEQQV